MFMSVSIYTDLLLQHGPWVLRPYRQAPQASTAQIKMPRESNVSIYCMWMSIYSDGYVKRSLWGDDGWLKDIPC